MPIRTPGKSRRARLEHIHDASHTEEAFLTLHPNRRPRGAGRWTLGRWPWAPHVLLGVWLTAQSLASAFEMGANVNENLGFLEPALLEQSKTPWVRGFLPVLAFAEGPRRVESDPGLAALLAAGRSGRRVILSLKWNLKTAQRRLPSPDSEMERAWFAWVAQLLAACNGKLDIFVLANEPMIDTMADDLKAESDGVVPFARFTERLIDRVSALGTKGRDGKPLPLYVGAFTRVQAEPVQKSPAVQALLALAARDNRVAGVDIHLHERSLDDMETALAYLRQHNAKPAIATELSLVWRYKAALQQPIGADQEGRAFATAHGLDPGMKVIDYLNACAAKPVDQAVWHEFLASQPWHMPDFLSKSAAILQAHGVAVAAYSFSQGPEEGMAARRAKKITADKPPYILNPLFVRLFCKPPAPGVAPVNHGVFADYLRLQEMALPPQTLK